jgi:hypothetical protein
MHRVQRMGKEQPVEVSNVPAHGYAEQIALSCTVDTGGSQFMVTHD